MNLLLDTHVLLWFLADDPQLLPSVKQRIEDPSNPKLMSVASCNAYGTLREGKLPSKLG